MQAAHVLTELQRQGKTDENSAFTEALTECYDQLYGSPEEPAMPKALKRYWKLSKKSPQILEELLSFRGQSPLSCGVWDTDNHLKTYDLFFLLANTDFEVMEQADFLQEVRRRGLEEREFKEQLLYLRILEYIPERQHLVLGLQYDLGEYTGFLHQIQILNGFFVRNPRPVWIDKVNRSLKAKKLVCVLSDMTRVELRQRLHLGAMFEVLRLEDVIGNEYSVAFSQEALLLDSLLFFRKTKGDKAIQA